ncbi:MAG: Flp pilus assembly complex ATPase component TadA [Myxococcales bacterium]|nr:Flp pilus assembly complex ATPase component TadA [Myxococcales bacterium]MCB9520094.1 Flp pilus assembly complex ATPase component TadA [Myxococcales bacterium]MCB9531820.1 Flp pilus assembly complex ATPase component TadA [Myxococcales bacterium]
MFIITVTERGEESETLRFDLPEVSIGRVRGNDVILPKGSVSKRHAKLVERDGRPVVIDLRSTNGTIVNSRKIAAPQTLRDGDRVVIGDYVLEVELGSAADVPHGDPAGFASTAANALTPPPAEPEATGAAFAVTHLGGDDEGTDNLAGAAARAVAGVANVSTSLTSTSPGTGLTRQTLATRVPLMLTRDPAAAAPTAPRRLPSLVTEEGFRELHAKAVATILEAADPGALPAVYPPSPSDLARVERLVQNCAPPAEPGSLGASADFAALLVQELAGLGPLETYLDDPSITEIFVNRHDHISVTRGGVRQIAPLAFGHPETLAAAARRVAGGANLTDPLGGAVRLPDGTRFELVLPPATAANPVIAITRATAAGANDLVASGAVTEPILSALRTAARHGGGVIVSATHRADATAFIEAVLAPIANELRIAAVEASHALRFDGPTVIRLQNVPGAEPSALLRAATLSPDVIVIDPFGGPMVGEWLLDVSAAGAAVFASFAARTPTDALSRLVGSAASATGLDADIVRRQIANAVDVLVQLGRSGGRPVVREVIDVSGVERDQLQTHAVFTSKLGAGGLEFSATGHVPRLFSELSAGGVEFDTSVFNA